jgi:hypothetical protein
MLIGYSENITRRVFGMLELSESLVTFTEESRYVLPW